jgi:hypothetical protein
VNVQALATTRILVFGFSRFARRQHHLLVDRGYRATLVDEQRPLAALAQIPSCDAVYQVGGPLVPRAMFEAARLLNRPIVKHWIGTDVLRAGEQEVRRQAAADNVTHWADAPWLAEELAKAGIKAEVVALSPVEAVTERPMRPQPLTALWYLPDSAFEFYGGQMALSLARRLPDARFLVVASERGGRPAAPNIEFAGYLADMEDAYERAHVLVRMPDHDGLSQMIIEALNRGRHAIWNYAFPHTLRAVGEEDVHAHLSRLAAALAAGSLELNAGGRDYVRQQYQGPIVADTICRGIEALARDARNGERKS